jgi:hypothetical protein
MLDLESSRPEPNPNHPKLGDTIKVEPIRTVNAINKIKKALAPSPRNLALFVVGINTAYRASELLSIRLGQSETEENQEVSCRYPEQRLSRSNSSPFRASRSQGSADEGSQLG